MNIYKREFIILYNYYLKHEESENAAIKMAKFMLSANHAVVALGILLLSIIPIFRFCSRDFILLLFLDWKVILFIFPHLFIIFALNKLFLKKLDIHYLCKQKNKVKKSIWWLSIFSWLFFIVSLALLMLFIAFYRNI